MSRKSIEVITIFGTLHLSQFTLSMCGWNRQNPEINENCWYCCFDMTRAEGWLQYQDEWNVVSLSPSFSRPILCPCVLATSRHGQLWWFQHPVMGLSNLHMDWMGWRATPRSFHLAQHLYRQQRYVAANQLKLALSVGKMFNACLETQLFLCVSDH